MREDDQYNADLFFKVVPVVRPALQRYVRHGSLPGAFLSAVLTNDLATAITVADSQQLAALRNLVYFLAEHCPKDCWGSPEAVANWNYAGGLAGRARVLDEYEAASAGITLAPVIGTKPS